jgi:starch phosphorylase
MRESMARLTPAFSANRMLRQYTEELYIPLASLYRARAAGGGRAGAELLAWQREVASRWQDLRFTSITVERREGLYRYIVEVILGNIQPADVRIEIYADPQNSDEPFREPMTLLGTVSSGVYQYFGQVPDDRPADHYTVRAMPRGGGTLVPLELPLIAWQK